MVSSSFKTIILLTFLFLVAGTEKSKGSREKSGLYTKSLYRSCAGSHFYGTEFEIWADFGTVGNTEKTIWDDY